MHFSTLASECRDLASNETKKWKDCLDIGGDPMSMKHVRKFVNKWNKEKGGQGKGESLVILTGDQ
jgi:hypothetical protein